MSTDAKYTDSTNHDASGEKPRLVPYAITGIKEGHGPLPGQVPLRRDVDEWYEDPKTMLERSLFVHAMVCFMEMKVDDFLSYYQVAGIHGQPLVPWDEDTCSQSPGYGYCTHNSILFPAWHRPYMILFEQRLYEIMVQVIIPKYPESLQQSLHTAANNWRMPYWDWAARKSRDSQPPNYVVPLIITDAEIMIIDFYGVPKKIENPLRKFTTRDAMGDFGKNSLTPVPYNQQGNTYDYNACMGTSRGVKKYGKLTMDEWVSGVQDDNYVADQLRQHQWYESSKYHTYTDSLGEAVYRLFSEDYFSSYDAFASTRLTNPPNVKNPPPPDYLSLEDIHNNIHNWCGGDGGHMCEIPVAAFDPIFWLHHCNVDRQFAIWQALNPDAWMKPKGDLSDPDGNWSTKPGTEVGSQWPLAPFRNATTNYYTSDEVRDWTKYGYSYPELQPWLHQYQKNGSLDQEAYQTDIRNQVNKLYGAGRETILSMNHHTTSTVSHADYIVNVLYEKFALGGLPFIITIFIGDLPDSAVGSLYNFSTSSNLTGVEGGCANCREQDESKALATGQVHITMALLHHIRDPSKGLDSLDERAVVAYLTKNLRWRVTTNSGLEVPISDVASLKVSVAAGTGTHYRDRSKLSSFRDYRVLESITAGRPGGWTETEAS